MSQLGVTIDVQQLSTWLGLPSGCWPPDHYALLGLPPGEPNLERIEHRVHQRLACVRSYQLSNPALVTEVMTQLAKAFDCLTDLERKKSYDATHFPQLRSATPAKPSPRAPTVLARSDDTAETPAPDLKPPTTPLPTSPTGPLQWQTATAPPPVRATGDSGSFAPAPAQAPRLGPDQPTPIPVPLMGSPLISAGIPIGPCSVNESGNYRPIYLTPAALPPVGTRRDLYDRVLWTRQFIRAWDRVGKYLRRPRRRLAKAAEEAELTRALRVLDDLALEVPQLIGQPGQPGYRVFALTAQEPIAERFKSLDDDHRVAMALDWSAGRKLMGEYRQHLMVQVKNRRRLSPMQRMRTSLEGVLTIHGGAVVIIFALLAILILAIVYVR